jgi:hypothetical protein
LEKVACGAFSEVALTQPAKGATFAGCLVIRASRRMNPAAC